MESKMEETLIDPLYLPLPSQYQGQQFQHQVQSLPHSLLPRQNQDQQLQPLLKDPPPHPLYLDIYIQYVRHNNVARHVMSISHWRTSLTSMM
ncbi:hypothetical protein Leryth_026498 [Lithospermum erythrorhizon]|nr:hypothetical protein Leryth_026498 [Lithospermum erythrorhizon]